MDLQDKHDNMLQNKMRQLLYQRGPKTLKSKNSNTETKVITKLHGNPINKTFHSKPQM